MNKNKSYDYFLLKFLKSEIKKWNNFDFYLN